jgi:predicted dehydrogenase
MTTTTVAVLGAGFMGSTHARALRTIDGVRVKTIYAHSPDRGKPLADELGVIFTQTVEDIFSDPEIEAIDICLPTPWHREMSERAIAAGKHVLLEKPLALNLEDADALVALAERTDRVFMIAHVLRFWPEYAELHRLANTGDYGKPVNALAYRRQAYPAWSTLFSNADLTGGAIVDMLIHDFDALNWVLGEPVAVSARGRRHPEYGGFDQAQVLIEYADGRSALVDGGMLMPDSYPFSSSLQVLLERGALEYHFQAGGRSVEMGQGVNRLMRYPGEGEPELVPCEQTDPYRNELAYFIECIRTDAPPARATPNDARLALKVALAAKQALELPGLNVVKI